MIYYLESPRTDPYFNLALEEYAFEHTEKGNQCFMLWQNKNTVVVGKYQNTAEEINRDFVEEHHIRVVRRLSGGGAVYHDKGNLNYTLITDQISGQEFDFSVFTAPVLRALEQLGIHAECNGRNDITIQGKKISGSSQYVKDGRLLHHGCIMVDSNLTSVADALRAKPIKLMSNGVKSVRSRVTTINYHAPQPINVERFKSILKMYFLEYGEGMPYRLSQEDMQAVEKLRDQKYRTWEWNYGRSPAYTIRREAKFPAGLVTVCLCAEHGKISDIHFSGDFFGSGEITLLEQAMQGLPMDNQLTQKLQRLHVEDYIHGVTAQNIAQMIRG